MKQETKKAIKQGLRKALIESPLFPLMTMLGKTSVAYFLPESQAEGFLGWYLAVGGISDVLEFGYRAGIKDEVGFFDGEIKQGKPYSCFEKHLLDAPKKVKKSINNFVEGLSYFDSNLL